MCLYLANLTTFFTGNLFWSCIILFKRFSQCHETQYLSKRLIAYLDSPLRNPICWRGISLCVEIPIAFFILVWNNDIWIFPSTAWKASKDGVFSGPYFPLLELKTEIRGVYLRIHSEWRKIWTRKNSVSGHSSRSASAVKVISTWWSIYTEHLDYWIIPFTEPVKRRIRLYILYFFCESFIYILMIDWHVLNEIKIPL